MINDCLYQKYFFTIISMRISKNIIGVIALLVIVGIASASTFFLSSNSLKGDFSGRDGSNTQSNPPKSKAAKMWWACIKSKPWTPPSDTESTSSETEEKKDVPPITIPGLGGNIGRGGDTVAKGGSRYKEGITEKDIPGSVKKSSDKDNDDWNKWYQWDMPLCPEGYEVDYAEVESICTRLTKMAASGKLNFNDPKTLKKYQEFITICRNHKNGLDWMSLLKNPIPKDECDKYKKLSDMLWATGNYTAEAEAKGINGGKLSYKLYQCQQLYGKQAYGASPDETAYYKKYGYD